MVKNPPANAGDFGLIPGPGISPGEGNGYPFQCQLQIDTCQEHYQQPNNRGICLCGNCVFLFSSVGKESTCNAGDAGDRGSIPRLGSSPRAWQPIPVFFPGESHGQRVLADYSPWGHKESEMTEATEHTSTYVTPIVLIYLITVSLYLLTVFI